MPWTADGPSSGFSDCEDTWLPIDDRHRHLSVGAQQQDDRSSLNGIRRIIGLRRSSSALRLGEAVVREASAGVLAFERRTDAERLLCLFELCGREASGPAGAPSALLAGFNGATLSGSGEVRLPPYGGAILRLDCLP
jgi:alpha-glucosidase